MEHNLEYYQSLEQKLKDAYGECDDLLEVAVELIAKHNGVEFDTPLKARLLTDDNVDKWLDWKEAEEDGRLAYIPYNIKVGQKLYVVFCDKECNVKIRNMKVCGLYPFGEEYKGKIFHILLETYGNDGLTIYRANQDEIGLKVFLREKDACDRIEYIKEHSEYL